MRISDWSSDVCSSDLALVEEALSGADYFQSLRTEAQFLGRNRAGDARRVISDLIHERVLKRHLWVASRKFRNQKAYTFHMEPEEGVLRYRAPIRVSPSRSAEHTSELPSLMRISYAVFCLKTKTNSNTES